MLLWAAALATARAEGPPLSPSSATAQPAVDRCDGSPVATVEFRAERPPSIRHDGPAAGGTLRLLARGTGRVLWQHQLEGSWSCLGYSARARRFVLSASGEVGVLYGVTSVLLLPEDGSEPRPSAFDRAGLFAYSLRLGPEARFLAMVAQRGGLGSPSLQVLDVERDRLRRLGPAPAPPPDPALLSSLPGSPRRQPWRWGPDGAEWYAELEPEVVRFPSPTRLEVRYGSDTVRARARRRHSRSFRLE